MSSREETREVELAELNKDGKYRRLFNKYDHNQDGKIDIQELKDLIKSCGHDDLPDYVVRQIFQRSDTDNDRYLTYDEFVNMMDNPLFKSIFQTIINRFINTLIPKSKLASSRGNRRRSSRGTYEDEYKLFPPPVWMISITIIQIILYTIDSYTPAEQATDKPIAVTLIFDPKKREEIWRWLTYAFVHSDPFHLVLNLLVQIVLGIPLEMVHHGWRVLITYFCGVLSGSLASSIASPYIKLVGASGGVYALTTAHVASLIINWKEIQFGVVQLVIFLAVICIDAGTSIYRHALGENESTSYVAHLGGGVAGLLVGIFVLRNLEVSKLEKKLSLIAAVIFTSLILTAVLWNVAYPSYFPK